MTRRTGAAPDKLRRAVKALEHALTFLPQGKRDPFYFAGIAKCFETCMEYAWKYLRDRAVHEGLDAQSPRGAIKVAGSIELIDDVEGWLKALDMRNLAVHDYIGVSDEEYLTVIRSFLPAVQKLTSPSGD